MEEPVIWCLSQVEPAFFLWALVVAVAAYFLGCFNGAVIVSKYILRDDVRGHGSGNAGLTNFYRTYGARYALCVIVCDMGKTVLACLIGGYLMHWVAGDWTLGLLIAGIGCELGHMFPVFFGFKGGKAVGGFQCAVIAVARHRVGPQLGVQRQSQFQIPQAVPQKDHSIHVVLLFVQNALNGVTRAVAVAQDQ
mgnify:CR=1 FL=1